MSVPGRRDMEKTLTVIHAVTPADKRQHYSSCIKARFVFWIKGYMANELIATTSLATAVAHDLHDNKCPYFFIYRDLTGIAATDTSGTSSVTNTFGVHIVRYKLDVPLLWDSVKTNTKYTDALTAAEMTQSSVLQALE